MQLTFKNVSLLLLVFIHDLKLYIFMSVFLIEYYIFCCLNSAYIFKLNDQMWHLAI